MNERLEEAKLKSCVKVEVAVLGSLFLIVRKVCESKATLNQRLEEAELRSCAKVEVAVLGSPSLTVPTVSLDLKNH